MKLLFEPPKIKIIKKLKVYKAIKNLLNFKLEGIDYINKGSYYYALEDGKPTKLAVYDLLEFMKHAHTLVEITGEGLDLIKKDWIR
jgi:hypothetical protein